MNGYEVLLKNNSEIEVVDTRGGVDYSRYMGKATSSWKKMFTSGARTYYNGSMDVHTNSRGIHIYTYPDKSIHVADVSAGDYLPPGYINVSRSLQNVCHIDRHKTSIRCGFIPIHSPILNSSFMYYVPGRNWTRITVYSNSTSFAFIGWDMHVFNDSTSSFRYGYLEKSDDGMRSREGFSKVLMSQLLKSSLVEGLTSIRIRCSGAESVLIGTELMTREDDVWTWTGDPIVGDAQLSILVGYVDPVQSVEWLND